MSNYKTDYIPDKDLYAAVMFARKMIRQGTPAGLANYKAARYYGVDSSDVAHFVGQAGRRSRRH